MKPTMSSIPADTISFILDVMPLIILTTNSIPDSINCGILSLNAFKILCINIKKFSTTIGVLISNSLIKASNIVHKDWAIYTALSAIFLMKSNIAWTILSTAPFIASAVAAPIANKAVNPAANKAIPAPVANAARPNSNTEPAKAVITGVNGSNSHKTPTRIPSPIANAPNPIANAVGFISPNKIIAPARTTNAADVINRA